MADIDTSFSILENASKILAVLEKRKLDLDIFRTIINFQSDVSISVDFMILSNQLYENLNTSLYNYAVTLTRGAERYILSDIYPESLDSYLTTNGIIISEVLSGVLESKVSQSNFYPEGYWELSEPIEYNESVFSNIHFLIEVSDVQDFSNVILNIDSSESVSGWSYEKYEDDFYDLPAEGITSNYAGRKIKYSSNNNQYLIRGEKYYFRLTSKYESNIFESSVFERIIHT